MVRTPLDLEDSEDAGGTYELPLMYGFGASVRLGESLTLSADFEIRPFSDAKFAPDDGGAKQPLSASGDDLNQLRVGAEYLIVADFAVIPIRAGFFTVPTLLANFDLDAGFSPVDQVTGTGFSIGTGLILGQFAIDVAWQRQSYTQDFGSTLGSVKTIQNTIAVSTIVYFN